MNITMKLPGELRDEISLPRAATKESADASAQAESGEPQVWARKTQRRRMGWGELGDSCSIKRGLKNGFMLV